MADRGRDRGRPVAPPLVPASTFHLPGDPAGSPYSYGRTGNPTWTALESAYSARFGGESVAFASGMGAAAAVFEALLPRGGRLVAPADCYYTLRSLMAARGWKARLIPSTDPLAFAEAAGEADLVWVETPSNPGLDVVDLEATALACKASGALLVVDNTLGTAAGQDPLALGADVEVVSATKATAGHSDAVIGLTRSRDPEVAEALKRARTLGGAIPGVLEAWLCLRGLMTLELRLERMSTSALRLAYQLQAWNVRYPAHPAHPQQALALRQMQHCGPVLTFDLQTQQRADHFCEALRTIVVATSFGGVESSLERRARWGGDAVSPGLIRMSVGLEDPDRLWDDLQQALDA